MGRVFLEHSNGKHLYNCAKCGTNLTNKREIISTRFTGRTGSAILFNRVVNIIYSATKVSHMLTGKHIVRDVMCKRCHNKLGWMYEFAYESSQRYKEGKVLLEINEIVTEQGFSDD